MNAIDTNAMFDAMLAHLKAMPWIQDRNVGEKTAKLQFMCMAGFNFRKANAETNSENMEFTGDDAASVIAIVKANDPEKYIAHEALCAVADDLTNRGKALPIELQQYIVAATRTKISRGRGGSLLSNLMRDDAIYQAVQIGVKSGLKATRNEATDKDSGCTIAREALKRCKIDLTESEVTTIYKNRRRAHKKAWVAAGNSEKNFK